MRGRVVHISGQPHDVPDAGAFHEGQQIGDLVLAPLRRAVAKCNRVFADQSDRQVGCDHLPGRVRSRALPLEPGQLRHPQDESVGRIVAFVPGRIAVAAHVDQKDIEQRPITYPAIDAAGLRRRGADRHEFMKRPACTRNQPGGAVLSVARLVGGTDRRPVIGHLMIVPLRQHRHLRIEGAQIAVEQVVFIVAAKLREAVRNS